MDSPPDSRIPPKAHLSKSVSKRVLGPLVEGVGKTGHGKEDRKYNAWAWAHLLVLIGLLGGITAAAVVTWTNLDAQDLDPNHLYTECGPLQFQCRTQRVNCTGRDSKGMRRVDCKAPEGSPICLPHDPVAARVKDPATGVEAGSAADQVGDGYLDCIADDQTISDFSDEMSLGGPDNQLKFVVIVSAVGAIIVIFSVWALAASVTQVYQRDQYPLFKPAIDKTIVDSTGKSLDVMRLASSEPEPEPEPEIDVVGTAESVEAIDATEETIPARDHQQPLSAAEAAAAARAERVESMP